MKTNAAVLVETGRPLEMVELTIPKLKAGQVLVEIESTAVCHTQVLEARGYRGRDPFLPHCLGHEGIGKVADTGSSVKKMKTGDRVVLSWMKGDGCDEPSVIYDWDGRAVNAGAIATFGEKMVISENRLTLAPMKESAPSLALLGCAISTGMGAVLHTARAKKGERAVVVGVGGVGIGAVLGCVVAGCSDIVAIDVSDQKINRALIMGATRSIKASRPEEWINQLQDVDFAIEATGRPALMSSALSIVRPRGGRTVVIGNARQGEKLEIDPRELNQGKHLLGTWGGDNQPDVDFPFYWAELTKKKINLNSLIEKSYTLSQINQALDDLEAGRVFRPMISVGKGAS